MSDSKKQNITAIGKDINIDARTVHVHNDNPLTAERLEKMIQQERKEAVEEYIKANNHNEKVEPLRKIQIFDDRLADMPKYYQEVQELITTLKDIFENMLKDILEIGGNEFLVGKLAIAQDALEKGDFSKSDDLFAEIETREELAPKPAARIAVARGEIARQAVRWHDAAKHFSHAAELDASFVNLLMAQKLTHDIGDYDSTIVLCDKARESAIKEYGENSEQHAGILNNFAGIILEYGHAEEAEIIYKKALDIVKKTVGDEHWLTATTISNIGSACRNQGRYEDAILFFKQAIEIEKRVLGGDPQNNARSISNLAGTYLNQGMYQKAEPLLKEVLEFRQKKLAKNHPDIAHSFNDIGGVYYEQKQYKKAEPMFRQALEILEITFGSNNHITKMVKQSHEDTQKAIANAENDASQ